MNSDYTATLRILKTMDEKQLYELFHDLGDIKIVENIVEAAYKFVDVWADERIKEYGLASIKTCNEVVAEELDWKHQDDARRYLDIKSTQDSLK
jgi:hypothetical protein